MKFDRLIRPSQVFMGVFLSILLSIRGGHAQSPSTPAATASASNPVNSALNPAAAQSLIGVFGSCFNFSTPAMIGQSAMSSMMMGGMAGGMSPACALVGSVSISTQCPGSDAIPDISGISSCETMNPAMINQATMMLKDALCKIQCNKAKSDAIQAELKCLSMMGRQIEQQMAPLNAVFHNAIQWAQQQITTMKNVYQDDQTKLDNINRILTGQGGQGGADGAIGLLERKQQTEAMLRDMPKTIQELQQRENENLQTEKTIQTLVQARTTALAMDCFSNRAVDTYKCEPNGPPVSAKQYVLCRFEQMQNLEPGGGITRNNALRSQTASKKAGLEAILNQFAGDAAADPTIGNSRESLETIATQPLLVSSPEDVERLYGQQLQGYRIGTTTAQDFVMGTIKRCYNRAATSVAVEQKTESSSIGQQLFNLKNMRQQNSASITQMMTQYQQQYSDNMGALTGSNRPMDTSGCQGLNSQGQINCLSNMYKAMRSQLLGTSQNTTLKLVIQGVNPASVQSLECQGINGCVTALQTANKNITTHQKAIETQTQNFILSQNQQIESYAKGVAAQLSQQSRMLNGKLAELNSALAALGAPPVQFPPMEGEQLQGGRDQLYENPRSGLAAIAGYIQPPMPDFSQSSGLNGIGQAEQRVNDKISQISSRLVQIQNLAPTCAIQRNRSVLENLASSVNDAAGCYGTVHCTSRFEQHMEDLNSIISSVGHSPMLAGSVSALQTGMQAACNSGDAELDRLISQQNGLAPQSKRYQTLQAQIDTRKKEMMRDSYGAAVNARGCQVFFNSLVRAKGQIVNYGTENAGPSSALGGR